MTLFLVSCMLSVVFINILIAVRVLNTAYFVKTRILLILRLLLVWAETWHDDTVKAQLMPIIAEIRSLLHRRRDDDAPMGADFGLSTALAALARLVRS